jgi:UDP-3-O-acyl N-acetylglucosamine deacetylase
MRVIGHRHQRTLAAPAEVRGVGFITGKAIRARFLPAPADAGVVFRRVDLPGGPTVAARAAAVTGTQRRTTLGPAHQGVTLVEHLLASFSGLRIDNCVVELDGPEPPGLDGSALGFVRAIAGAGAALQSARRSIYSPAEPLVVSAGGATVALHPATEPGLRASYLLDYGPFAPIPRQLYTLDVRPENFVRDVAACRTFLTEAEALGLRAQGIGAHLTAAELLVFGDRGPIDNRLRFADEPARHKVLDLLGDLSLCGFDLAGHLVAYRSGHALNVDLARRLVARVGPTFGFTPVACPKPARRAA